MAYTPPSPDSVDFTFTGDYTPPSGDDVDLLFGIVPLVTVVDVSRTTVYDTTAQPGFNTTIIKWTVDATGPYQIEVGGDAVSEGYVIASGTALAGITMENYFTDTDIEAVTSFSGTGTYEFNVYAQSSDDIWNSVDR